MIHSNLPVKVLATSATQSFAQEVCSVLNNKIPFSTKSFKDLRLSEHETVVFSNGNLLVKVPNVRGHQTVVLHTQAPPVHDQLFELFALLDAINNAQSEDVLLVFPYMPYSRSDIKDQPRISTMAAWMAREINRVSMVKKIILLDPHAPQIKHYFEPAADEVSAIYLIIDYLQNQFLPDRNVKDVVVVYPDAGAFKRFGKVAGMLKLETVFLTKTRNDNTETPDPGKVVGNVSGKDCIVFDDEIATGGTAISDADLLMKSGAKSVSMTAVHAILQKKDEPKDYVANLLEQSCIEKFVITDSVPVAHKIKNCTKFTVLSVAGLISEAINRSIQGGSLTELHTLDAVKLYR